MSTHTEVFELLQKLEQIVPPPVGCHHSLTCSRYGDETIWEQRLALNVWVERADGRQCHTFWLDEADFEDTEKVFDYILKHLNWVRAEG